MDRSKKENAIAGKLPKGSKKGRGKSRELFLTGNLAEMLGRKEYSSVKMSDLTDAEIDKLYKRLVDKKASTAAIARQVALRHFKANYTHLLPEDVRTAFRAKEPLHKMMGEILNRQMGISDAPEQFFTQATGYLMGRLSEKGLSLDLEDPKVYPFIRSAVNEIAKKMKLV